MRSFDVFNGDADGLCALHMLRLSEPREALPVSGTKRDNALLGRVAAAAGDEVTVLDLSLEPNLAALHRLLASGVRVRWFDHHFAPTWPQHPLLEAHIDTSPQVCTSVLVDRHLQGRHRRWAVVAAFGDNMHRTAAELAATLQLTAAQVEILRELGECLNYNAYGESEGDLVLPPVALYRLLQPYSEPLRFVEMEEAFERIRCARDEDMRRALAIPPLAARGRGAIHRLPDEPWSRRVIGSLANHLAGSAGSNAVAVLAPNSRGGFAASVRAPRDAAPADVLCRRFGGGGRASAAGIDDLRAADLEAFQEAFLREFAGLPSP